MDRGIGVNHITAVALLLQAGGQVLRRVANLQRDTLWRQLTVDAVEVVDGEVLLVGRLRVVAVTDVEHVLSHVLLHYKPRAAAEAHTLALADGVKPQSLVLTDALAGLQLDDVAGLFAKIATDIFVIVDLSQKADALRVLAAGTHQVFALSNHTHLVLHVVANGEQRLLQLPVVDLC